MGSERARLVWRCRRGTKELDLILGRFLETDYVRLDADQRQAFERLLECEDDLLQDWLLTAAGPVDAEYADIVAVIRRSR